MSCLQIASFRFVLHPSTKPFKFAGVSNFTPYAGSPCLQQPEVSQHTVYQERGSDSLELLEPEKGHVRPDHDMAFM